MTTTTERSGKSKHRHNADGHASPGGAGGERAGGLSVAQERTLFFKQFLKKGVQVASFVPSSKAMARAAARAVDPEKPQVILELGAGTGPITREILARKHPHSRVIALELDPSFVPVLRRGCPGAEVVEADVRRLPEVLAERNVERVDVVINGLPTPSLPEEVNRVVIETIERFGPEAAVTQITVMPLVYQKMYKQVWERVEFEFVVKNVPPAGVYHMRKLRADWRKSVPGK
jgi:phosphatidylethanolamine/phosphatidyl-N-methylethanolamine N-methyltransferase